MKKQRSPLITYIRLGQRCVRRRPTHVSNPRTPKQQANRLRFAQRYAHRNQGVSAEGREHPKTGIKGSDPLIPLKQISASHPLIPLRQTPASHPLIPPTLLRVISE